MKHREFTNLANPGAVVVSTTGYIQFNGKSFVGDCETTTDIPGHFYRTDSTKRNNLLIEGMRGGLIRPARYPVSLP